MRNLNFIRKGILLHILFIYSVIGISQPLLNFTQTMDSLFAPLDKNRVTTGILYERVMPWADIDLFNLPSEDTFISKYSYYCQAYFELYNAAYNKTGFLKPKDAMYIRDVENYYNRVPVGILDYLVNRIDSLAIQNNQLFVQSNMFYDVPGRSTGPLPAKHDTDSGAIV